MLLIVDDACNHGPQIPTENGLRFWPPPVTVKAPFLIRGIEVIAQ
jgi:hypothetical protein